MMGRLMDGIYEAAASLSDEDLQRPQKLPMKLKHVLAYLSTGRTAVLRSNFERCVGRGTDAG